LMLMLPSVWSGKAVPPILSRKTVPLRMAITLCL
jgi:hypothetical protein